MKSLLPTFNRRPVGNPAGGINSTLSDMIKYIRFHLNNGQVEGRALISKQSANEMHKPQIPVDYFAGNPLRGINDYGLGWQIETYRNQILVHHGGWIEGYVSWVSFMPSERLGVVVLSNKQTLLPFLLNWWIYDQMLGLRSEPETPLKRLFSCRKALREQNELNSSNRPKLIGRMKMGIGPALQKNLRLWHSTC